MRCVALFDRLLYNYHQHMDALYAHDFTLDVGIPNWAILNNMTVIAYYHDHQCELLVKIRILLVSKPIDDDDENASDATGAPIHFLL